MELFFLAIHLHSFVYVLVYLHGQSASLLCTMYVLRDPDMNLLHSLYLLTCVRYVLTVH